MADNFDDSLFEDKPYDAPEALDDSLFEDTPFGEEEKVEDKKPEMGKLEAAAMGLGEGGLLSFSGEASGLVGGALEKGARALGIGTVDEEDALKHVSPEVRQKVEAGEVQVPDLDKDQSFKDLYHEYRQAREQKIKQAQEEQPGAFLAGAATGGLALPGMGGAKLAQMGYRTAGALGGMAAGAATGTVAGGVSGFGAGEGDLESRIESAKEGAKYGAGFGAAIPFAGGMARTGTTAIKKIKEIPFIEDMLKSFGRGAKGESLVTSAGRREAAGLVSEQSEKLFKDIDTIQKNIGTKMSDEIRVATESGKKVDLTDEIKEAESLLKKIRESGTKEADEYARGIQAEINRLKGAKVKGAFDDIPVDSMPEGMIRPKAAPKKIEVSPEEARDFELAIKNFRPQPGMSPLQIKPAGVARDLYKGVGEKLSDVTKAMPELKKQYGHIKDSLRRLKVKSYDLPEQTTDKINKVITRLEKENLSGDEARRIVEDVFENIKKVSPETAQKHKAILDDVVDRLDLSDKIIRGGSTFTLFGTPRAVATAGANIAGLTLNKLTNATPAQIRTVASLVSRVGGKGNELSRKIMEAAESDPTTRKALFSAILQDPDHKETLDRVSRESAATRPQEPKPEADKVSGYKKQRKIISLAQKSSPEDIQQQAQQIREQYGEKGEPLANILDALSQSDKKGRNAKMFQILQNPAYKKMLGIDE